MCTASTRVPGQLCLLFLTSSIRAGCHHNSSFGPVPPERTAGYVSSSAKKQDLPLYTLSQRRCRQISSSESGLLPGANWSPPGAQIRHSPTQPAQKHLDSSEKLRTSHLKQPDAAMMWLCQLQLPQFYRPLQARWPPTFETPIRDGTMRSMSAQR